MKLLLLGANSFYARSIIPFLVANFTSVLGVSRSNMHSEIFDFIQSSNIENYSYLKIDLVRDYEIFRANAINFQPDVVIDALGEGMVDPSWDKPDLWVETNVVLKVKFIQELHLKGLNLKKYIRISTPEVYGSNDFEVDELQVFNPSTPYAVSHAAIDQLLNIFFKEKNFPTIIARYGNFYGPYQQEFRLIPKAISSALISKPFTLEGDGMSYRSFIFRDDLVTSVKHLLDYAKIGNAYHFSSNETVTIKYVVEKIYSMLAPHMKQRVIHIADRRAKDKRYSLNIMKSTNELNWIPKVNLDTGIDLTSKWLMSQQLK